MGVFCRGASGGYKSTRKENRPRRQPTSKNARAARLFFPSSEAGARSLGRNVKKAIFSPSRESFFFLNICPTLWLLPPPHRPWKPPTPPSSRGHISPETLFMKFRLEVWARRALEAFINTYFMDKNK